MQLLDLPAEVLCLILSFLCTRSLATARLACRALRDASSSGQRRLVLELPLCYRATARASPAVLQSMHTFQILQDSLDEQQRRLRFLPSGNPYDSAYGHFGEFLKWQLLSNVAQEVESLPIENRPIVAPDEDPPQPHVFLARMPRLERLKLGLIWHDADIQQMRALRHLTSLELEFTR